MTHHDMARAKPLGESPRVLRRDPDEIDQHVRHQRRTEEERHDERRDEQPTQRRRRADITVPGTAPRGEGGQRGGSDDDNGGVGHNISEEAFFEGRGGYRKKRQQGKNASFIAHARSHVLCKAAKHEAPSYHIAYLEEKKNEKKNENERRKKKTTPPSLKK